MLEKLLIRRCVNLKIIFSKLRVYSKFADIFIKVCPTCTETLLIGISIVLMLRFKKIPLANSTDVTESSPPFLSTVMLFTSQSPRKYNRLTPVRAYWRSFPTGKNIRPEFSILRPLNSFTRFRCRNQARVGNRFRQSERTSRCTSVTRTRNGSGLKASNKSSVGKKKKKEKRKGLLLQRK